MKTTKILSLMLGVIVALSLASCSDDDDYSIATGNIITEVTTGDAVVTAVSATITGTVLDLSQSSSTSYSVGVYYGTSSDPTTSGSKQTGTLDDDGTVTTTLSGLTTGTTYYYATFVTLQSQLTYFGEVKSFVATQAKAETQTATDVSYTKATFSASVSGTDGLDEYSTGVKIDLDEDVTDGAEYELGTVTGLLPGTTYYYATYVQVGDGYVYGDTKSLTTLEQEMEYVDLGLSVLWAAYNIGAEAEEESGALFGYGDKTAMLTESNVAAYSTGDIAGTESDIVYDLSLDGSSSPMKSQMPTATQIAELISGTTQTAETVNGVSGIRFTASNGNSIFLPMAGYRDGETTVSDGAGYYWSGTASATNDEYANTLALSGSTAKSGTSKRSLGLSLRTVRAYASVTPDAAKIIWGDIEGNGNFRIEIYNEYGSTASNPPIDASSIVFSQNMVVTFTLSGISDNLVDGAAGSYTAGLEYSDPTWGVGYWSGLSDVGVYEAVVTGDNTYTVWMETSTTANGAIVFCVDIGGLAADIVDMDAVSVTVESIELDKTVTQDINDDIVEFNNKDGNGTDGRIEIYNEYGNSGSTANGWYNDMAFYGMMIVDFTISGIDGNLVDGAAGSYSTELSFADAGWYPSYWGGADYGSATVTGDGSYRVYTYLDGGLCEGAVVWTIELYGLWQDLVDTSAVSVSIDSVTTPGKQ